MKAVPLPTSFRATQGKKPRFAALVFLAFGQTVIFSIRMGTSSEQSPFHAATASAAHVQIVFLHIHKELSPRLQDNRKRGFVFGFKRGSVGMERAVNFSMCSKSGMEISL